MKKIKICIIVVAIIIIILTIILFSMLGKNNEYAKFEMETPDENTGRILASTVQKVSVKNNYFIIKEILDNYYYNISNINNDENDIFIPYNPDLTLEDKEKYVRELINSKNKISKEYLYNILAKDYIDKDKVTIDNINRKIAGFKYYKFLIDYMYFIDNSENISTYFIYGKYVDIKSNKTYDDKLMVVLDKTNSTYNIYPYKYVKYIGADNLEIGNSIEFDLNISSIESNNYNKYEYKIINDTDLIEYLVDLYNNQLKYNIKFAYSVLNKEYSNKKFDDINTFDEYINNNDVRSRMSKYNINNYEKYTQYICVDGNENYYIFDFKNISDYSVILDTYTIDLPQFIEKYNSANIHERVAMNIEKFIKSLNSKDYRYAYNCLADGFKNNKFKNFDIFKNYIIKNIFENNIVEYESFKNEGETYIYNINLKNANNEAEIKQMQVIMKLEEGTNFIMSFNFRE